MKTTATTPTENNNFDINQELALFLKIAMGELKLAIREASSSVQTLTKTYMDMVREVHEIKAIAETANGKEGLVQISKVCDTYLDKVQEGTVGFQFYDKLSQRLCHTSDNMLALSDLAEKEQNLFDAKRWQAMLDTIRSRYNTEKDRNMFDAVMEGASIKEALRIATERGEKKPAEGSIELF